MEKKFTVLPMGEKFDFVQKEVVFVCKCLISGKKTTCKVKTTGKKPTCCPLGYPIEFVKFEPKAKYGDFVVKGDVKQ